MPEEIDGVVTQIIPIIQSALRPELPIAEVRTPEPLFYPELAQIPEPTLEESEVKPQVHKSLNGHGGGERMQALQTSLGQPIVETPRPASLPVQPGVAVRRKIPKRQDSLAGPQSSQKGSTAEIHELEKQCRQLYLSVFFREHEPLRSIGFTSSLEGEGKSVLSIMMARVFADDTAFPVTLLECNLHHANVHEYFDFATTPGLAEWLRGECSQTAIQRQVTNNLTVIPAGNGERDAVILLQKMRSTGVIDTLVSVNELVVVDLPAVMTTPYGVLAASLVEGVFIIVRAGVTPEAALMETCKQLRVSPVEGLVLNQVESRIPRWIRQIL